MIVTVDQFHQTNSGASSQSADNAHLKTAHDASLDIGTAIPTSDNTSLDISKNEERDGHDGDTVVKSDKHLTDNEIRNQGYKSSNEIAQSKSQRRHVCLVATGLGLLVVESEEKVAESVWVSLQCFHDFVNSMRWKIVCCKCRLDN